MKFIDLTGATAQQRNAMRLIRDRIDNRLGYPKAPTKPDGTPYLDRSNPTFGYTLTCSVEKPHPSAAGRFGLPISPEMIPHLAVIRAAIRAKVLAGTATAVEVVADTLPAEVDADPTWSTG